MSRALLVLFLCVACGSADGPHDAGADSRVGPDVPADVGSEDVPDSAQRDSGGLDVGGPDSSVADGGGDAGPVGMCADGVQNGLEIAADCGGPDCEPCEEGPPVSADALYVDPTAGDDAADGSVSRPWRTLAHAFAQLAAGDELVLRGGRYAETALRLTSDGTEDAPIRVRGMPGEEAIIDASLPIFSAADNDAWEVVDASIGLYRSRESVPSGGYVGRFYEGDAPYNLVPYTEGDGDPMANISATNEAVSTEARYAGPGFLWENDRLYIRLTPLATQTLNGETFDIPSERDPNRIPIHIGDGDAMIALSGSFVEIRDIAFHFGRFGIRVAGRASNLVFSGLHFEVPYAPLLLDGGVENVLADHLRVRGGIAPWVAWTDMKGSDGQLRPASHWSIRSTGVNGGGVSNVEVHSSHFERVWDGHVMSGNGIHIHHNRYDRVYDDTIQLGSNSVDVEIDHNIILGAGPSHNGNGDSAEAGRVYIHHNVIDASAVVLLWGKEDPTGILRAAYTGWHTHSVFPTHAASMIGEGNPWKIYFNTVVHSGAEHPRGTGANQWTAMNSTGVAHEVYNNIFVDTSGGPLLGRTEVVGATRSNYQIYDGNVYHRMVPSDAALLVEFAGRDFDSLASFLASSEFEASRAMLASGWESRGTEGDPALDESYAPAGDGPAASGAVALPDSFPGERHDYRGAVAPRD